MNARDYFLVKVSCALVDLIQGNSLGALDFKFLPHVRKNCHIKCNVPELVPNDDIVKKVCDCLPTDCFNAYGCLIANVLRYIRLKELIAFQLSSTIDTLTLNTAVGIKFCNPLVNALESMGFGQDYIKECGHYICLEKR